MLSAVQDSPREVIPPLFGTAESEARHNDREQQQQEVTAQHDPLAASSHEASALSWQHYPEPPAAAATSQTATNHPTQSISTSRYPSIPVPADFNVSLASPQGSAALDSASPSAAALGAAAVAVAASGGAPASPACVGNPELRVIVHNPLKHMGPSGIPGLEEAYISYEVTTITSMPHFSANRITVRRRFRDFVSLANLLPKLLHGR